MRDATEGPGEGLDKKVRDAVEGQVGASLEDGRVGSEGAR
jgi:hypothetical protein